MMEFEPVFTFEKYTTSKFFLFSHEIARDVLPSIHGDQQMHISGTVSKFVLQNGPLACVIVILSSPSINFLFSCNRVSYLETIGSWSLYLQAM